MDSLEWSRKYEVLSISRLTLRDICMIPSDQVVQLSNEDMERIAEIVGSSYSLFAFNEQVQFVTRLVLVEIRTRGEEHE